MYRHFNNKFKKDRNSFNPKGRGFSHARKIKSFDPSMIAALPQRENKQTEYVSQNTFSSFEVSDILKKNIAYKGYKIPTPIQDKTIPVILSGKDVIGQANTGTGKTAAFLIPLIDKVLKDRSQKVIILAPTRELASQICDEFYSISKGLRIYAALCIGGASMNKQRNDLKREPNFVIGTPGRLEDHIRSKNLNLFEFETVVLDEADHMVDVGFLETVKRMILQMSPNRQSLFFSATLGKKVEGILSSFVKNPVRISTLIGEITTQVKQEIIKIDSQDSKINELCKLLTNPEFRKVLIFGRTKHGVQKLANDLKTKGFRVDAIHGNKRQNQRTKTLENFKRNNLQVLIATDVASRGIDVPSVSHVINYDLPESYEAYIHRIGRTGRAEKQGIAITFVNK